jgi:hypothetical protein
MRFSLAVAASCFLLAGVSEARAEAKCGVPPNTTVGKCLQRAGATCDPSRGWVGGSEAGRRACFGESGPPRVDKSVTKETCSTKDFCTGWQGLCVRRALATSAECRQRYAACLSSECFYFSDPRPRCRNNPTDLALTTICHRVR